MLLVLKKSQGQGYVMGFETRRAATMNAHDHSLSAITWQENTKQVPFEKMARSQT